MNSPQCPNCSASIGEHDRFCENCGAYLAAQPAAGEAPGSPYEKAVHQANAEQAQVAAGAPVQDAFFPMDTQPAYAQPAYAEPSYAAGYPDAAAASADGGTAADRSQPAYAQPVYAPPAAPYAAGSAYGPAAAPGTAFGLAITSLVLGLAGVFTFGIVFFLGFVGIALGIAALALRSGYRNRGLHDSHAGSTLGLGIAGIIANVLAIGILVAIIAVSAVVYDEEVSSDIWDDLGIADVIVDEIDA